MKRRVLTDFFYCHDGKHPNLLKAGRSYEIRDEHVARFEAEGKIEPTRKPVVIGRAKNVAPANPGDMMFTVNDGQVPLIGAAKPEAIVPLARGDDGKLGTPRRRKPKAE